MNSVLYQIAALIAWSAAAYKMSAAIRRPREVSLTLLVAALSVLGLVLTISTPAMYSRIDYLTGWPNLSFLLSRVCVIIWAVIFQVMMVLWIYPSPAARHKVMIRLSIASWTIAVMVVMFLLAPILPEESTDFAAARFAVVPSFAALIFVYILAFAWMQGEIAFHCLRIIQLGGRIWLRRGLRTTAIGAGLGIVSCLVRASEVIFAVTGLADPVRWEGIIRATASAGVVLLSIGWTMPSWGPRLSRVGVWAGSVRNYWRLYPLWYVLCSTFTDKDLDPPRGLTARIALRDVTNWRLLRRLAVIWDCMLELLPYRNPDMERSMAGFTRPPGDCELGRRATMEAKILLAALTVYRHGGPMVLAAPATVTHEKTSDDQLSGELDWLVAVSRAIRSHPSWRLSDAD